MSGIDRKLEDPLVAIKRLERELKRLKSVSLNRINDLSLRTMSEWTDWTPATSGITIGSGSLTTRYFKIGTFVACRILFLLAADSDVTSAIMVSIPVPAHASYNQDVHTVGSASARDDGAATYEGAIYLDNATGGNFVIRFFGTALSFVNHVSAGTTAPHDWAAGDHVTAMAIYESAE